jgi:hypothetical protein
MWLESGRFVEAAIEAHGCTWAVTPSQICAEIAVIKTQNAAGVPTRTVSGLVLLEEFVPRNRLFRDLR